MPFAKENASEFQVRHYPGHSPGSIGLFDEDNGILVSGDTLYRTEGELIDWFPGGSVRELRNSVEDILGIADKVDVVLPGHNEPIQGSRDVVEACERHLEANEDRTRKWRKSLSRWRASVIISTNFHVVSLPDSFQALIQR